MGSTALTTIARSSNGARLNNGTSSNLSQAMRMCERDVLILHGDEQPDQAWSTSRGKSHQIMVARQDYMIVTMILIVCPCLQQDVETLQHCRQPIAVHRACVLRRWLPHKPCQLEARALESRVVAVEHMTISEEAKCLPASDVEH